MNEQIILIDKILKEVISQKANFNEAKKQARKYLKQGKSEDFILNYLVSNQYLFYDKTMNLASIYNCKDQQDKVYETKQYLVHFISFCWHLSNKVDNLHKYQIQMIKENYKDIENPRKAYQKTLVLNRSTGKDFDSYTPFLDIYTITYKENLECIFGDKKKDCETKESDDVLIPESELMLEFDVFLHYYNVASVNKKDYRKYAIPYHPFYSLLKFSYHLFLEQHELYQSKSH